MKMILPLIIGFYYACCVFNVNAANHSKQIELYDLTSPQRMRLLSQTRTPYQSYADKIKYLKAQIKKYGLREPSDTPAKLSQPYQKIDYSHVPQVNTYAELYRIFSFLRGHRELLTDDMPNFKRRISWLYPLDGCWARAGVESFFMHKYHLKIGKKIFAFGNLSVHTKWLPGHIARWDWHVSIVLNLKGVGPYVLDPAVDQSKPLPVNTWFELMNDPQVKGTVCNIETYALPISCNNPQFNWDSVAIGDESGYLEGEWNNIIKLGLDPTQLLGDAPPWKYA